MHIMRLRAAGPFLTCPFTATFLTVIAVAALLLVVFA